MKLEELSNAKIIASLKACASLDIELCEEENLRCYKFYENWSNDVDVATYENGGGDDLVIIIKGGTILIKGFDHESDVSPYAQEEFRIWPGMYDGAPEELIKVLEDEAFEKDHVTFCIWRQSEVGSWNKGSVVFNEGEDDGSSWLLSSIKASIEEYVEWGKEYYEEDFECLPIERIQKYFSEKK